MTQIAVYTDLDGSLLDHHDYSHAAADSLLQALEKQDIPVIPVSSKTRAELLPLRKELNNRHPFIVENGAAVFIPQGYFAEQPAETITQNGYWVKVFTSPRSHWLDKIDAIAADFPDAFINFARLDINTIIDLTGLNPVAAQQASEREFGEPVHWLGSDTDQTRFVTALEQAGANVLRGGRFLHISGNCGKGRALLWLNEQYKKQPHGIDPISIAIGDSQNDVAMLEAADHALIIRSPSHQPPVLSRNKNSSLSHSQGPTGWDEGLRKILHSLNNQ